MAKRFIACMLLATASCQTIDQLFTVDASTCAGINLDNYLNDARTLLASAQTAISAVQSAKTFTGGSNNRHYMRMARNAFGTAYYSATTLTGISSADQGILSEASGNVGIVQTLLSGQTAGPNGATLGPNNAKIFCSDASYQSTTNAHDIDPSKADGTSTQEAFAVPSLLYVPDASNQGVQRTVVRPNPNMPGRICQTSDTGTVIALTQTQTDFTPDEPLIQMVLCPAFFNAAAFRQSLAATPGANEYLGDWKFAAGTFVHELYHIFGDTFNDKRFYANDDSTNTLLDPYGPEVIYSLANSPADFKAQYGTIAVLNLPDTYRMFSTMANFAGTKWYSSPITGGATKRSLAVKDVVRQRRGWRQRRSD